MKKLTPTDQALNTDVLLLVLRIGIAGLMLSHGLPKMMLLFSEAPIQFPPVFGLSPETALLLTVGAEVFCSLLILVGAATRLAVVPLMITMLVAIFLIHGADPFAKKELAVIYLLVYTALQLGGSGRYSLDYILQNRRKGAGKAGTNTEDPTSLIYQ